MKGSTVRTGLIRIGNSRGIRIPKPLIEMAGLRDSVELRAEQGRIVIQPGRTPREGWEESFRGGVRRHEDLATLAEAVNDFDTTEWRW